jgi:D-glycero-beta-D-manno-heptose-7-phosphate kinase
MTGKSTQNLIPLVQSFKDCKVLIVGDVMIDTYLTGNVDRISPESPVPVVEITNEIYRLGGAGNVALNVHALGAKPLLCSVTGNDPQRSILDDLLQAVGMPVSTIIASEKRRTTQKTRIISRNHQMLRYDYEIKSFLNEEDENRMMEEINGQLENKPDVIILQDYNKGVLTKRIIDNIIKKAREKSIPVAVDPKKENFFRYRNATLFKPNLKELIEGLKLDNYQGEPTFIKEAVDILRKRVPHDISMITLSEDGILVTNNKEEYIFPSKVRNVADVSGAGDTVISVAALCLARNSSIEAMAYLSNLAGGIVCEEAGVVPVDYYKLIKAIE